MPSIGARRAAPSASAAGTSDSVGLHHAGDIVVPIAFYNLGVSNDEVTGKNWLRGKKKAAKITCDIEAMFAPEYGIQAVLLSEVGNMYACIDAEWNTANPLSSTQKFFEAIVSKLKLNEDIVVCAHPPYVALVDSSVWDVTFCEKLWNLCDYKENFAMHLLLCHKASGIPLRVLNCHIPSSHGTPKRKEDTVKTLGKVCTQQWSNRGGRGPVWTDKHTPHWIIGGDLNIALLN